LVPENRADLAGNKQLPAENPVQKIYRIGEKPEKSAITAAEVGNSSVQLPGLPGLNLV